MAGDLTYTTGTISVAAGATSIVGVGTAWGLVAQPYDLLVPTGAGYVAVVKTVVDDTHITPFGGWQGSTLSGVTYTLLKTSPNRFANADAMQVVIDSWEMLQQTGIIYAVVGAGVLPDVSIGTNGQYAINLDDGGKFYKKIGDVWVPQGVLLSSLNVREKLSAARTYFWGTGGNDANSGLLIGSRFLTLQKAIDTVAALDMSIYQVIIQMFDGTLNDIAILRPYVGVLPPIIQGNQTVGPQNTILSNTVAGASIFSGEAAGLWQINDMELRSPSVFAVGLRPGTGTVIKFQNIRFGNFSNGYHIGNDPGSAVKATGAYLVTGNAAYHIATNGFVNVALKNIAYQNTVAFSGANFLAGRGGVIDCYGTTFTNPGIPTTPNNCRAFCTAGGVVFTSGAGGTFIPGTGSTPGFTEVNGGRYL